MRLFCFVVIIFFAVCCSTSPDVSVSKELPGIEAEARLNGKAVKVIDGDTFDLLHANNTVTRIRLYGIDCPERGQDFSKETKNKLSELIFSKQVLAVKKDIDRYGRTVAIVMVDRVNVNEAMLRAGMAWHFTRYDQNPAWTEMERVSRARRTGLWSQKDAVAPWKFRSK